MTAQANCRSRERVTEDQTLRSNIGLLNKVKLELAYFSGLSWLRAQGAGVVLRFERVRPRQRARFQPLQHK